jgi:formylglycine-generating enzyme required for sulfatase activity
MTPPRRVFLAHAREDKERVRPLYKQLKQRGFNPWLDEEDLLPGQMWEIEIQRVIREAGAFIACLSQNSVQRQGFVHIEFRLALRAYGERPPGAIFFIPVRLDECEVPDLQIPNQAISIRGFHWLDLWQEGGFERLIRALESAGVRPVPNGAPPEEPDKPQPLPDLAVFRDIDAPWCPEMVALPAGAFLMGSPEDEEGRFRGEGPQHPVTIGYRFAMGRYPVTFAEYDHFCGATKREKPGDSGWGRGRRPVINVTWQDATAYCDWLVRETRKPYRLPSEAEWEYACRAGTATRYWCGDMITRKDAKYGGLFGNTTEVGSYALNPWGLYDTHGDVWEWVEDVWHKSYEGAPADGAAWTDGEGKQSSRDRVLRGGSWLIGSKNCRSANRGRIRPGSRGHDIGFRVARTLD